MKNPCPTLITTVAIFAASLTIRAEGWETYEQVGLFPIDLAAQADGSFAYVVGDYQSPGSPTTIPKVRRGANGGTLWEDATLPEQCYRADKLAAAPDGTIYLTGWRFLEGGTTRAPRVWASADRGTTWREVAILFSRSIFDISVDAAGNVFLCTSRQTGTTAKYPVTNLVTYKGQPDPDALLGMNWTMVDDYSATGQYANFAKTLTIRPPADGNSSAEIWVAGYFVDSKTLGSYSPLVRRSLDGGINWATVSTWTVPSGYSFGSGSWSTVAAADPDGIAYATASYGKKVGKDTQRYWLTYCSTDAGAHWTLKDTVSVGSAFGPDGIATDIFGGVFLTGGGVTRASVNGGTIWGTVSAVPGGWCVTADLAGNVFVGGSGTDGAIYKLPAPPTAP